jgi:uncharacterized protein (UPF0332 family)
LITLIFLIALIFCSWKSEKIIKISGSSFNPDFESEENMKSEFFQKSQENLEAAQLLFDGELYNASANRAYYAAFQMAIAILAVQGISNDKYEHGWVHGNFNTEMIHRHKFYPSRLRSYLPDLQAVRNRADYKDESLSRKIVSRQLAKTKEFIEIIQKGVSIS